MAILVTLGWSSYGSRSSPGGSGSSAYWHLLWDLVASTCSRFGQRGSQSRSRTGNVKKEHIDEVVFGNVFGAGLGQNVARQVSIGAGFSPSVGATTVNKVCGSGRKSAILAAQQAVQCGDAQIIVAGGTENMSAAPHLLAKARMG